MYNPLEPRVRHEVPVKQAVSYGSGAELYQARCDEEDFLKGGAEKRAYGGRGCFLSQSTGQTLTTRNGPYQSAHNE